jgi:O-antigen/teichoic acid export membrane protein
MSKPIPSLKRRYINKLTTQLIGMCVGLLTAGIVPRALGPTAYGSFHFLIDFFGKLKAFFDMGSSTWFFTTISKKPKEKIIYVFYGIFLALIMIALFAITISIFGLGLSNYMWPEQQPKFILMALIFVIGTFLVDIFNKVMDAHALTIPFHWMKVIIRSIFVGVLLTLYFKGVLSLSIYFIYQYLFLFMILIGSILIGMKYDLWVNILGDFKSILSIVKRYWHEFFEYVHPLLFYSLVGLFVGILDRWMLQFFSGSEEQGFYSLSYNISQLCFLFSSSLTPLLLREFSVASESNDLKKMKSLFGRYIPLLYSITAFFSCFALVQSEKIILLLGGEIYLGSLIPLMLMVLYPIHQTYGQLSSSVFFATGQTKLYRNIGLFVMFFGLIISFILMAPQEYSGLNLGALGLSIKMVVLQFIGVNIGLYFNARYLNLSFFRYLLHQFGVILIFLLLGFLCSMAINKFIDTIVISFVISGVLYSLGALIILWLFPSLIGFQKNDIEKLLGKYLKY